MTAFTVYKQNHLGERVWSYTGEVVERGDMWVCIRAVFSRSDVDAGYIVFRRGDVMTEWFYADRWYNVFRIHDGDNGQLKGWYCNITRPATITADSVGADDLALDVFITPVGTVLVLDEDEFAALDLPDGDRIMAWNAVDTLRRAAAARIPPFDVIQDG